MKAALYTRVSTAGQGDPAKAMDDLRDAARQRRAEVVLEVAETGSGARADRPGLAKVMDAARKGKVDLVLVPRLDRFGRSTVDLLHNIKALTDAGVRFACTEQAIDVSPKRDPMGQFMLTVLSAVAEFERALIRDRVVEGQRRAAKKGKHLGRPWGSVAKGEWNEVDPGKVVQMREDNKSWNQIAEELNCTRSAARRAATRAS